MRKLFAMAAAFLLLAAAPAVSARAAGDLDDKTAGQIDQYVAQAMKAGKIPGLSLAIVRGNEVVYLKGYGYADGNRPVTPQTPFTICSVGKAFTALAIRQLAGQGKLYYNAPVQTYIPWFTLADAEAAKEITIQNLVDHKSGLSTDSGTEAYLYGASTSIEDAVRSLKDVQPDRPVGSAEEYSNLNFIILGLIVEKVSGMSYGDYVQKYIFDPVGMAHSYTDEAEAKKDGSAMGHSLAFWHVAPAQLPFPPAQMPAGYQLSSAEDMAKFAMLYLNNGYVNGKSIIEDNLMAETEPPYGTYQPDEPRYGVYWVGESGPVNGYLGYYGHEGMSASFSTMLLISPSTKTGIVVLTNCNNGSANPVISAATIARDISAEMNNGMGFPEPAAGFENETGATVIFVVVVLLLMLRAVWSARFRRNISRGKVRRVLALATYALLDGALPLAALVALPLAFRVSWPFLFATNTEPAFLLLLASAALLLIFIVKTVILISRKPAPKSVPQNGSQA